MPKLTLPIVSIAIVVVYIYAMQTGHYLAAGVALSINGLIALLAKPPYRKRLFGAFALGFLITAVTTRQLALYVGLALLIGGLQIARHLPKHRKLGLLAAALGGLLVAYGLGYLG